MTTTTQTNGQPARPSYADCWGVVQGLINAGLIPLGIRIHPNRYTLTIEMPHNDRGSVDRVLRFLGVPLAGLSDRAVDEGKPTEWRAYGYYYNSFRHPSLPNMDIHVSCLVMTQADASEHWSGSIPVGCTDHRCHCGQTFEVRPAELATVSA